MIRILDRLKTSGRALLLIGFSLLIAVLFWFQGNKNAWVDLPFINRNTSNAVYL
jgi:hypothetical protein